MGWLRKQNTDIVVDLREHSTDGQHWGEPGLCPSCGRRGYLDRIDLVARDMYQHCPQCGEHWVTSERDLQAAQ